MVALLYYILGDNDSFSSFFIELRIFFNSSMFFFFNFMVSTLIWALFSNSSFVLEMHLSEAMILKKIQLVLGRSHSF